MAVGVDDARRQTAQQRRANIIETLSRELDPSHRESSAARLASALDEPRSMIVSGDIDGIVSAAMLARVVPHWTVVAVVMKSERVWLHPDVSEHGLDLATAFGVDIYGTHFPSVSNHVVLWGQKKLGGSTAALGLTQAYDDAIRARAATVLMANASLWAGIEGSYPEAGERPLAAGYRYPLGTAQLLLALLEVVGLSPRMFDRDYLPWLVANCDGGLKTIRDYPYNVPMWWSCLAAAVGPASLSEHLYQLAMNQRPTEFIDTVNRLRSERSGPDSPASHLDDDWNLRSATLTSIQAVTRWITSLSGWPDPFRDGVESFDAWVPAHPTASGKILTTGLPSGSSEPERLEELRRQLVAALDAVHTNFAFFDGKQRLNWVSSWEGATVPDLSPLPAVLRPGDPGSPVRPDLAWTSQDVDVQVIPVASPQDAQRLL